MFSAYAPDDGSVYRPKCKRGSDACKYFHPPKHLGLQVINAGRNNKRLRQEMASKMKVLHHLQSQQQQQSLLQQQNLASSALTSYIANPSAWTPSGASTNVANMLPQTQPIYYQIPILAPSTPAYSNYNAAVTLQTRLVKRAWGNVDNVFTK